MGFVEMLLLAVGVSMDAFAVSVCKGLSMQKAGLKEGAVCGLWFGGAQALMPLLGYFLGSAFSQAIYAIDHWIAFGLLAVIGINMLVEAIKSGCDCCNEHDGDLSFKTMLLLALATSIDALAVGVSLAMAGNVRIVPTVALIGGVTGLMCMVGVKVGAAFGARFQKPAQITGGVILILLDTKILLEHLGIPIFG